MSSLKDPVTPIDLSPNIPNSISTSDIAHYCYPLIWSLYSPDALIEYISTYTTAGSAQATVSLKSVSYRLFATVTLVAMLMVTGYGVLDSIFGWIMGEELFDLFNLMAGWIGVFLGALATFIYFSFVKNPALRIASQAVIGLTSSIMTGLFFMDPRLQLPGYFAIFASIGLGSVLGFYFNTLAWYEQDSLLVNLLLVLASIAVGGFVFIQGLFIGAGFQGSGTIWFALIVGVISFVASTLRIDDWLCHRVERLLLPNQSIYEATPRVTWLKSCKLVFALENDLEQRWQQGLQNCIQVLRYTNQHWAVLDAIHTLLDEKSEGERKELMVEVEQLWQTLFRDPQRMQSSFRLPFRNCDLSVFLPRAALKTKKPSSASRFAAFKKVLGVGPKLKQTAPEKRRAYRQQIQQREEQRAPLLQKIPLTTPVASAVAGIRYLEQERSKEAGEAFDKVKFSPLGAEMAQISEMLETLWTSENLPDSGLLKLPKPPANPAHKDTWKSFALFRNIVRYVWILKRCAGHTKRGLVGDMLNDAIQQLLNSSTDLVEQQVIQRLAVDWQSEINVLISTNSSIPTLKPVQIRFVFTEPLTASNKSLLIDRKAEQAHLKVAWKVGNFQPLLICGQQQIGKTSLVQASLDSTVKLASIQLQQLGARSNAVHILQLICDEILRQNIYPLQVIDRLREDPYPIFSGYMKDVCLDLGTTGLVIVLDGFEFVEQQANRLEIRGLLSFLWSLSQSESNLGIAFLTTSTLAELNATFDTSFTRYMQPITLGFLTEKGVATFLRNPTPDFLPYCHDLAVRRIMELTAGQPYLVQLSAWFLFDWYNNQIRAGNPQDPLLTNVDVKQALESTRFELQCERYYRGMVDEAKRIDPEYALPILKQIAREPKDPSSDELLGRNLERPLHTDKILDHLEAHLIIERIQTDANMPPRWRIKVPIFHEWLKKQV